MALKAGYVGVKRWLYEKLTKETAANKQSVADLWNDNALTGVKNLNTGVYTSATTYTVVWTVGDDGVINANGTATGGTAAKANTTIAPFDAQVILNGCNSGDADIYIYPYDATASARPYKDNTKTTRLGANDNVYNGNEISFWMEKGHSYNITCRVIQGKQVTNQKFYPMLRLATDPDSTYVPAAKTNLQLTANIAADDVTLNDHKITINGIISAATGAADFAAFKTAMAALSPLTRSAAPDTRAASPEVIEDEPEPVTKKTSSTKKTATIKEGE